GPFPSAYALPDPGGRYLFAGGHGAFDITMRKTPDVVRSAEPSPREPMTHFYLPASSGPFYMHYPAQLGPPGPGGPQIVKPGSDVEVSVYAYGQNKPIAKRTVP